MSLTNQKQKSKTQSVSSTDEEFSNSAIESEDMPDTQPFRSGVQLPSVGGTYAHYLPDTPEAPQMMKRYVTAGRTEIKDSQSSSFTNSESQHSVEDSSQRVPDTDPMRPSIPLAPVTRVSKRPAPDEESKAGERYDLRSAKKRKFS